MDKQEAIEVLSNNRPRDVQMFYPEFKMFSNAIDIAIAAIEESMVQKPATNSESAKCPYPDDKHRGIICSNASKCLCKLHNEAA